ncbi:MAG: hypothetical protein E6H10_15070 [Bacteroidetes bacterium]|nr:MAG: hypothetical protein E6H10_15070 [Bacteroidota bacterium]
MSFIRVWIHYVWSTKNRDPILKDEFRYSLFDHISESQLETLRTYIDNQEMHHQKKTFEEEYQEFIKSYRFK